MRPRALSSLFTLGAVGALAVSVAGCDSHHNSTGPSTGTIVGTVTSSLGGSLDSVSLTITPAGGTAMTAVRSAGAHGSFRVADIPVENGKGAIAVSNVPFNCTAPQPVSYTGLDASDSISVPIVVTCVPPTGTISGTITSSLGGGIANASVVVTPTGGTALAAATTSQAGAYTLPGVALGGGTIAVSQLPVNCTAPAATPYTALKFDSTMTVNIAVTCAPLTGTVSGVVTSSLGGAIANATITITPTGQAALATVQTSGAGAYSKTVPVGAGTGAVAVTSVPNNCTNPAAAPYTGLSYGKTVTVNVTVTCTPLTGSLTLTLTVPNGVTPSVTVTGPGGYNQSVSATQTLTSLTPGTYTVSAATFRGTGGTVTVVDTGVVTGSPATVTAGATALASVTYSAEGPAGLWVANSQGSNQFSQFVASQLSASGSPTPTAVLNGGTNVGSTQAAFDHSGNLWSVDVNSNQLHEYTASQLSTPAASPAATITYANFGDIAGLAFDASGNLWIADYGPCELDEYTAAQLAGASGTAAITPSLIVNPNCSQSRAFSGPTSLAFDASGNLWVIDRDYGELDEFTAASLVATGTKNMNPALQISTTANAYVAFDASGNLWLSNSSTQIIEYSSAQLGTGGSLTPAVTITTAGAGFQGLAFDNSGNLWAVDHTNAQLDEFATSQLAAGGAISPTLAIGAADGSANDQPWTLAFYLHSSSLPLYNRVQKRPVVKK